MLPAQETKYSLLWALTVVKMLKKKYARASEATGEFYKLTDENVAMWLAKGSNRWTNYRTFVKTVERWVLQQEKCRKNNAKCGVLTYPEAVKALDVVFRRKYLR